MGGQKAEKEVVMESHWYDRLAYWACLALPERLFFSALGRRLWPYAGRHELNKGRKDGS